MATSLLPNVAQGIVISEDELEDRVSNSQRAGGNQKQQGKANRQNRKIKSSSSGRRPCVSAKPRKSTFRKNTSSLNKTGSATEKNQPTLPPLQQFLSSGAKSTINVNPYKHPNYAEESGPPPNPTLPPLRQVLSRMAKSKVAANPGTYKFPNYDEEPEPMPQYDWGKTKRQKKHRHHHKDSMRLESNKGRGYLNQSSDDKSDEEYER